jgi:hypothetical protein
MMDCPSQNGEGQFWILMGIGLQANARQEEQNAQSRIPQRKN